MAIKTEVVNKDKRLERFKQIQVPLSPDVKSLINSY